MKEKRKLSNKKTAATSGREKTNLFRTARAISNYVASIIDNARYRSRIELEAMLHSKVGATVDAVCEKCGASMKIIKAYGESYFAGCANPECEYTRQLTLKDVETVPSVYERECDDIDLDRKLDELIKGNMSDRLLSYTEASTREEFIDPILLALGWDISKRRNVGIELRIDYDSVADYVLFDSNGEIFAIVEAKNLYENLTPHQEQLFGYMRAASVDTGILTNGFSWQIYKMAGPDTISMIMSIDDILKSMTDEQAVNLCDLIGAEKNYISSKPKLKPEKPPSPLEDGWVEFDGG